ncbi:hypothetical protein BDW02DRAFT_516227, partial [Decorospora gaudefroyi]
MHSSSYIALLTGIVTAQESATLLNFLYLSSSDLTVLGSDASATTYKNSCPSDGAGVTAIPTDAPETLEDPSYTLSDAFYTLKEPQPFDTPVPKPRMRRQQDDDDYVLCEPYTMIQGPETYELHLTDPAPGAWTLDVSCSWQGAMTAADFTCSVTESGYVPVLETGRVSRTSVLSQSDIQSLDPYQVVALVTATSAESAGQTPAGDG